jgi:hypothetical protein
VPPPARKIVLEKMPDQPPKPQNILIEKWLPYKPRARRVVYERSEAPPPPNPHNLVIEWDAPNVEIEQQCINLGVVDTDPCDYVRQFGPELKQFCEIPDLCPCLPEPVVAAPPPCPPPPPPPPPCPPPPPPPQPEPICIEWYNQCYDPCCNPCYDPCATTTTSYTTTSYTTYPQQQPQQQQAIQLPVQRVFRSSSYSHLAFKPSFSTSSNIQLTGDVDALRFAYFFLTIKYKILISFKKFQVLILLLLFFISN